METIGNLPFHHGLPFPRSGSGDAKSRDDARAALRAHQLRKIWQAAHRFINYNSDSFSSAGLASTGSPDILFSAFSTVFSTCTKLCVANSSILLCRYRLGPCQSFLKRHRELALLYRTPKEPARERQACCHSEGRL